MNNSTLSLEYSEDVRTMLMVGIYINNYYLWVIFAFGFPGNLASVVTILRMQRVTTSTFYVATLAVVDNFAIILKLLYHQLTLNQIWLGAIGCKLLNFFTLVFPTCANWILVFIATERFVAVRNPLKVGVYWTIPRAVISVVCLVVVVVLIYCHVFWTYTGSGIYCEFLRQYLDFYRDSWYWINSAIYSLAPCVLLITLNFLIIQSVRKSTVLRNQLSMKKDIKKSNASSHMKQERQITVMLVSVAVVFVILTVPRCVYVIIDLYWRVEVNTLEDAQKYLMDQLTFFLCDSNHAINFYLYFITGKKFRRHFLEMTRCWKKRVSIVSMSQSGNAMTMQTKYKLANLNGHIGDEL